MKQAMRLGTALLVGGLAITILPSEASAWELFRSENPDVREGNERLAAGDPQGAIAAYDRAVATLPGEPAVRLDRGLALLHAERFDEAREELLRATEPPASAEIRGAAHYDLGLAFYRQADAAASAAEPDHEEAQRLFREAADAFRSSLRQVPGNRDAGWNLELALRRIREQEQQQQQQEEQEQQEQEQQEQQDGEQQDGEQQDGEPQDGEQQDGEQQDGEQQDGEQQDGEQQDGEQQDGEQQDGEQQDQQQPGEGEQEPSEGEPQGQDESESTGTTDRSVPPDMARVLDALQDGEENLERSLARSRGQREQRRVEQDW